jgi:hypothetical protein
LWVDTGKTIAMRSGSAVAFICSTTGTSALAESGGSSLASAGSFAFISAHTAFETVTALPFKSRLMGVTTSALVPTPMVAAIGWPASMCASSSSPAMTRSSSIFQLACASRVTNKPSSSKKPCSLAITSGAQSVSLMKPSSRSSFSGVSASGAAAAGVAASAAASSATAELHL